ncbi:MAG: hypothetical protein CJBNEKGG_00486 [Prosthecobacter sp.]|nr:hypothetical protein [Prosthecobacter sp.]
MFTHPPAPEEIQRSRLHDRRAGNLRRHGFTLIEVILAMGLIGLLIGGVYSIANGALQLGTSMNNARVAETRLTHFTAAWRDYLENLPPGIRLSCGIEKARRGAAGNLLIEGGQPPFIWTRRVRLADAVEFAITRSQEQGALQLNVRHLRRLEKPNAFDAYEQIAELPLLHGLKEFRWEFYNAEKKRWFASWNPEKDPVPPLYMRLHFQFLKDPREYDFTYWIANDLVALK